MRGEGSQDVALSEQAVIGALAALAQSMRLRVFRALVVAGPTGLTPGALTASLDVPGPTLSFHLKGLSHAGLVSQQRDGRNLIYRASFETMNTLMSYLSANCCEGRPCLGAAAVAGPSAKDREAMIEKNL